MESDRGCVLKTTLLDCTAHSIGFMHIFRSNREINNGTNSLQLFVVDFDTCLVWSFLLLPPHAQTAPNLPSLKGNR